MMKYLKLAASGEPDIASSYAGEAAAGYVAGATFTGQAISNGLVTLHKNVPYKMPVRNLALGGTLIQSGSCDWNHSGTVDIAERVLTVSDFSVMIDMCKREFYTHWESRELSKSSAQGGSMPKEFQKFFIDYLKKKISYSIDQNIWIGGSSLSGAPSNFTGIWQLKWAANGNAADTTSTVTWSASTIVAELRKAYMNCSNAVRGESDFALIVPTHAADYYKQSLGNSGYLDVFSVGEKPMNIDGYKIVTVPALGTADAIICGRTSDYHYGTWLDSDESSVSIVDMEKTSNEKNVRYRIDWFSGVQITNPTDISIHLNTAP